MNDRTNFLNKINKQMAERHLTATILECQRKRWF